MLNASIGLVQTAWLPLAASTELPLAAPTELPLWAQHIGRGSTGD
jgi:hypothetical protein